ncbi:hypothetical protein EW145_g2245 [Phellinidium pouzarii]|uniref:Protein kinase domain-containing protein n=1 Tax=Phellinidium pouzarii TaxID=167371 RepID=A0A4S4LBK0_9AGAM|nr:hypothetical protein EW145_g2245 [Phellinidium pouzarii]
MPRESIPIDIPTNAHVDNSYSLCGDSALNESSNKPLISRISTSSNDDDLEIPLSINQHTPSLGSLGMVGATLQAGKRNSWLEGDVFKAASAPEWTNAFPQDDDVQPMLGEPVVMSPAQSFLSMFAAAPASSSLVDAENKSVAGYTLAETIGHGGFSTVKKAFSSIGEVVAIKIVSSADIEKQDSPEQARKQLSNEVAIWRTLNHEHVLPLFDVEHTPYADYLVTIYCPAGSLFDILKRNGRPALPQDDAGMLFRQVVRGLRYLHETAKLVHGDIKLENVLVDEAGMCRIGDFGLSKHILDDATLQTESECQCERGNDLVPDRIRRHSTISHAASVHLSRRHLLKPSRHRNSMPHGNAAELPPTPLFQQFQPGSLPYVSPELLSPPSSQCALHVRSLLPNPAQDMWALGVLLYALLSGQLPFSDNFEPRLQMKILHGAYDLPLGIGHGAECVLRGCLEQEVCDRWTINMVDDVAWGVGWGQAGDVSEVPSASSSNELVHGTLMSKKTRSRSRARPYPDPSCVNSVLNVHISDVSSTLPSSSTHHARRPRTPSTQRSSERTLHSSSMTVPIPVPMTSTLLSNDRLQSPDFHSYPPTVLASRGRRTANSSRVPFQSRSQFLSQSQSHSRSRSWSESPTTPPDTGAGEFVFQNIRETDCGDDFITSIDERDAEFEERGRPRAVARRTEDKQEMTEVPSLDQDLLASLSGG